MNESLPLIPTNNLNTNTNSDFAVRNTPNITMEISPFRIVLLVVFAIFLLNGIADSIFVVQPGSIGLIVTLGKVVAVESGLYFKYPFISKLIMFSAKTQKLEESNNTPTKEGLSVQLDTAM